MTQEKRLMDKETQWTYDEQCEELALHFLHCHPKIYVRKLAQHIQNSVEDWIMTQEDLI
jgi:hypothetical protein